MDTLLPSKSKTVIANEPPWINKQMKYLFHEGETAFVRGEEASFPLPRNRVPNVLKSKWGY